MHQAWTRLGSRRSPAKSCQQIRDLYEDNEDKRPDGVYWITFGDKLEMDQAVEV
jgi:hypothetical protein